MDSRTGSEGVSAAAVTSIHTAPMVTYLCCNCNAPVMLNIILPPGGVTMCPRCFANEANARMRYNMYTPIGS